MLPRKVSPELLDELHPRDPLARQSRRDLRRINAWMGNPRAMANALARYAATHRPLRLLELGSGDGSFLARVSDRLGTSWAGTHATLLDRHPAIDEAAVSTLRANGWQVQTLQADVFDWFARADLPSFDVIIANLFLHHFYGEHMTRLLEGIAGHAPLLIAVEPRRTRPAVFFSRFVWLIGCNRITQHDASVSVQAGFVENELSTFWPQADARWEFEDRPQGLSNHLFVARRLSSPQPGLCIECASSSNTPHPILNTPD